MAIINSMLDNDLYKFNMLQFIVDRKFDKLIVGWQFFPRGENRFPIGFGAELRKQIRELSELRFTYADLDYIYSVAGGWLNYDFIYGYLRSYRMHPEDLVHVSITANYEDNYEKIYLNYQGEWAQTIMLEVPILAIMNELYGSMQNYSSILPVSDIRERNKSKFQEMHNKDVSFYEFGTRRRYSFNNQDLAIKQAKDRGVINGTSNLYFAKEYDLPVFGTMAHELFSVFAAVYGVESANYQVLSQWSKTFGGSLGIALTDTFTTDVFYQHSFNRFYAKLFDGLREDSATDTKEYVDKAIDVYKSYGIDPSTKTIVHSNGISSVDDMEALLSYRKEDIQRRLGVGTFITNDVSPTQGKLNNWVIKTTVAIVNGQQRFTVKLSDTPGKVTSIDNKTVDCYKYLLGL